MEAPERIYIHPDVCDSSRVLSEWMERPLGKQSIEYTRTDAFIKKACELLARMVWEVTYEDLEGNSVQHYDKMEFIEDFKNYMKEE